MSMSVARYVVVSIHTWTRKSEGSNAIKINMVEQVFHCWCSVDNQTILASTTTLLDYDDV